MRTKELEALVLSLQDQLIKQQEWATSEIAKRDAIIEAQAAKIVALEDKIRELTAQLKANSKRLVSFRNMSLDQSNMGQD